MRFLFYACLVGLILLFDRVPYTFYSIVRFCSRILGFEWFLDCYVVSFRLFVLVDLLVLGFYICSVNLFDEFWLWLYAFGFCCF